MGRSTQEQALQNRAKIVETASRLFRRFGVDNVSVADVMKATGMTTGGFYKHFVSKDALVQEAVALAFKRASVSWNRVSNGRASDAEPSSGLIVEHYFQKKPPDQTCPMIAFAPHVSAEATPELSQEAYSKGAEGLFRQFLDHMRETQPGGNDHTPSEHNAKVLFAAMIGAEFLARATGDADWTGSVQAAVGDMAASPPALSR